LDVALPFQTGFNLQEFGEVLKENEEHILGIDEVVGLYERK